METNLESVIPYALTCAQYVLARSSRYVSRDSWTYFKLPHLEITITDYLQRQVMIQSKFASCKLSCWRTHIWVTQFNPRNQPKIYNAICNMLRFGSNISAPISIFGNISPFRQCFPQPSTQTWHEWEQKPQQVRSTPFASSGCQWKPGELHSAVRCVPVAGQPVRCLLHCIVYHAYECGERAASL
jgi:hypothetical protein